jgi:hypothetical protein
MVPSTGKFPPAPTPMRAIMTHWTSAPDLMLEARAYEGDKVGHGSGKDTEDTGKEEGRVPCNPSTVPVNKVLQAGK